MNVTKEDLWNCLQICLKEKNCTIEGELEDLKEGLFQDYKVAIKYLGPITTMDFIECFIDEMFNFPLQMCDNMITPNASE